MPRHDPSTAATALPAVERWPHASLLVVDDEPGMLNFLQKTLTPRAGQVLTADSAEAAEVLLQKHRFDLVILDISLPGKNGITLLREMREQGLQSEVVLITAFADLETAIEALRAGASDFLLKPFRVTQVLNAFKHGMERARLKRENWVLKRALSQRTPAAGGLVGRSIVIKGLHEALRRVAAVDSTVLLTGESGTGKELAALSLHRLSAHAGGLFVPVNCATVLPGSIEEELFGHAQRQGQTREHGRDGLFLYAQGGTLFLDEIAEMPLPVQASVLRVLETRRIRPVGSEQEIPVDLRIVAATNRPLRNEVAAGRFRADLFYRLQVVEINLPPLASHKEDIPDLVAHFITTLAPQLQIDFKNDKETSILKDFMFDHGLPTQGSAAREEKLKEHEELKRKFRVDHTMIILSEKVRTLTGAVISAKKIREWYHDYLENQRRFKRYMEKRNVS